MRTIVHITIIMGMRDMDQQMVIIRPPSEANSFLLPVTFGCSHNRCSFCGTYKGMRFGIRGFEEIRRDIDRVARDYSWSVDRVFLENGDALIVPQPRLGEILLHIKKSFPGLERVGIYGNAKSILRKSVDDLKALKELGLRIIYLGVETGDEVLLQKVRKGVTCSQMVEAGSRVKKAGILLSATVILGLGGVEGSERHALDTARILSTIDPDYASALTLMLHPNAPLYEDWKVGRFTPISSFRSLEELRVLLANSSFTHCFFTSNHASNYLPLRLMMPEQKEEGIKLVDKVLSRRDPSLLRPEFLRAL